MMKRIIFTFLLLAGILFAGSASAQQRLSYVDTEYILEQLPAYRSAQKQLDEMADQWKKEIQKRMDELDKLYKNYQAEWVLLPEETRKKREEEISQKEKTLNEYKKTKFGPDGELFKQRQQLIKPIQDKVYEAVQQVAKENQLDFIFDKAGAVTMLFSNPKYDRSDEVLDKMGVSVKEDKK
jgi:outer membrane protein